MLDITSNPQPSLIPQLGIRLPSPTRLLYNLWYRKKLDEEAHFSVSCVECLGQFGKVVVDCVVLQSPAISSKTLVQRNGVPLAREGGMEGGMGVRE